MRQHVILASEETGERLYLTSKNVRNTPDRLVLKKILAEIRPSDRI